jgi:putative SOS response-associated peptidase YedK
MTLLASLSGFFPRGTSHVEPTPRHRWNHERDPAKLFSLAFEALKESETTNDGFGFLTTEPNNVVGPIHSKAMPVILTTEQERGRRPTFIS